DHLSENQVWLLLLFLSKTNNPTSFLKSWRMPTKKINYLSKALFFLHKRLQEEWTVYSLYQATKEISIDVESVYQMIQKQSDENIEQKINEIFLSMPIQKREELKVTGTDLMTWFERPRGPWIKQALEMIEKAVVLKIVANEKKAIKGWILTCNLQQENDC
ncbi:CCA tRNA nucleotidyltransferase, partial [Heyndrickxia sporothermodurans]